MDCLTFLSKISQTKVHPLYVVAGDEDFLKRLAIQALKQLVLEGEINDFTFSIHPGDKATYAGVMDELQTVPFMGPRRLVIVENADPFVSGNRARLEKGIKNLPGTGVLVLEVKSWPSNTKLAKAISSNVTVTCKAPYASKIPAWCVSWAKDNYDKQLTKTAADLLVELIGPDMGQLDQELNKLAIYVGSKNRITDEDVDKLVGRSQAQNTWKIFDAIGNGNVKEALGILDRLFEQREEPLKILGAFSMQLRKLAKAGRLTDQGMTPGAALQKAGVPPFAQRGSEQQLRHFGPQRTSRLYDWLLEFNLNLRGNSQLDPRILFERLVIHLAAKEGSYSR